MVLQWWTSKPSPREPSHEHRLYPLKTYRKECSHSFFSIYSPRITKRTRIQPTFSIHSCGLVKLVNIIKYYLISTEDRQGAKFLKPVFRHLPKELEEKLKEQFFFFFPLELKTSFSSESYYHVSQKRQILLSF